MVFKTNYKPAGYWDIKDNIEFHVNECNGCLSEFSKKYSAGYKSVRLNGWVDEFFPNRKKLNYWRYRSKDEIKLKSEEYSTQSEFQSHCKPAYDIAKKKGWLSEFYDVRRVLTYEFCKKEVSKYNSYTELNQSDPSLMNKIRGNGWNELISHWDLPFSTINPKWTYERCKEEVLKMVYLDELQGTTVINVLRKNGWFDDLTSHLIRIQHEPYTQEEVLEESKKYETRNDFRVGSPGHYGAAKRLNIMSEAVAHMGTALNKKQFTKEEILESARRYTNQRDWINNEPSIYRTAVGYSKTKTSKEDKEFWFECISHMDYIFKPNGYWTYDKCKEVTLKYNDRRIFNKEQNSIYTVIQKEGWDDLLEHMVWTTPNGNIRYPKGYFEDKESAREEALKYKTRTELQTNCHYAYRTILNNGWGDELFSHMIRHATNKPRYIYCFIWDDLKIAYVGLTENWKRRKRDHLKDRKGSVYKTIKKLGVSPSFKLITKKPVDEGRAPFIEDKWIKHYESLNYEMLNKVVGGSLGGKRSVWTKKNIMEVVNKSTSMKDFYSRVNGHAINQCKKMGIFDEIVDRLSTETDSKLYTGGWTAEDALREAQKYQQVGQFQKNCSGGYKYLLRNNLLREVFPYKKKLNNE